MARTDDMIEHPVTGERIEFLETARDTDGEALRMRLLVEPRGFAAAEHVHPRQDERFEILSGTESTEWMSTSPRMTANPIGAPVDPGAMIEARKAEALAW
jgi:hypothetical protein